MTANGSGVEPPPALGRSSHAITVGRDFRIGEARALDHDAWSELIEGEIIDLPPIRPPPASTTNLLTEAIRGRAIVSAQHPVVLGHLSAPNPIWLCCATATMTMCRANADPPTSCS